MSQAQLKEPWYEKGVAFECTGCGGCCQGSPGYVWVTIEEIQKIAKKLNLSIDLFSQRYVRKIGHKYSLKELPQENNRCVFLKGKQCQIYEVRPKQCRTYPYWPSILKSQDHWEQEKKICEGINDEASLVSIEEIKRKGEFTGAF